MACPLPRRRMRMAASFVLTLGLVAGMASCSSSSPVSFNASGVDVGGQRAHPGQAISFAAFLTAEPSGYSLQVRTVRLIPLPGFRTPRLLGAVFLGQRSVPLQAFGYPPDGVRTIHRSGHAVRSGAIPHKRQVVLMYGLRGWKLGSYAVAGIRITYTIGNTTYSADIYNGALLYYYPRHQSGSSYRRTMSRYAIANHRVIQAMQKLPGVMAVQSSNK